MIESAEHPYRTVHIPPGLNFFIGGHLAILSIDTINNNIPIHYSVCFLQLEYC